MKKIIGDLIFLISLTLCLFTNSHSFAKESGGNEIGNGGHVYRVVYGFYYNMMLTDYEKTLFPEPRDVSTNIIFNYEDYDGINTFSSIIFLVKPESYPLINPIKLVSLDNFFNENIFNPDAKKYNSDSQFVEDFNSLNRWMNKTYKVKKKVKLMLTDKKIKDIYDVPMCSIVKYEHSLIYFSVNDCLERFDRMWIRLLLAHELFRLYDISKDENYEKTSDFIFEGYYEIFTDDKRFYFEK